MSLESIRNTTKGPIGMVIIGLIFISFAIFGISANIFTQTSDAVATVEGIEISRFEHDSRFQAAKRQFGNYFDQLYRTDAQVESFRRQILEQMIEEKVLQVAFSEKGARVSSAALKDAIQAYPIFQKDGKFDLATYNSQLAMRGYNDETFRELQSSDLLRQQIVSSLTDSEVALPFEAELRYKLDKQTRTGAYVEIKSDNFKEAVSVSDEEIQGYYDENQDEFRVPEKVIAEYVELSKEKLMSAMDVTDAELQEYYDNNKSNYVRPGPKLAAHILFDLEDPEAEQKAQSVYQQIKDGADFAEMAKQHSIDTDSAESGGELGWQNDGDLEPALNDALFALTVGEVSEPVKSEFGYHILKNLENGEDVVLELSEVKAEIIDTIKNERAEEVFYAKQQTLTDKAFEISDSLTEVAQELELEVLTTDSFPRTGGTGLAANPVFLEAVFSADVYQDGLNSEVVEVADFHVAVVRLKEKQPSFVKELAVVKQQIQDKLVNQKAGDKAKQLAQQLKQKLASNQSIEADLAENNLSWKDIEAINRNGTGLPVFVRKQLFSMQPSDTGTYDIASQNDATHALVKLTKVTMPEVKQDALASYQADSERYLGQAQLRAFVNQLKQKMDIKRKL